MIDFNSVFNRQHTIRLKTYDTCVVIGVGGIGSWVAYMMALSGQVSKLVIFDPDSLETSNLNRTPFKLSNLFSKKVDAVKELIIERRLDIVVQTFDEKFDYDKHKSNFCNTSDTVIFDCRDEVYSDLKNYSCKIWKLGYDGLSVTLDGDPNNTFVYGSSTGYETTPSFLCPSIFIANLAVMETLVDNTWLVDGELSTAELCDDNNMYKGIITFDCASLLHDMHNYYNKNTTKQELEDEKSQQLSATID